MSLRFPRHARKTAVVCLLLSVFVSFFVVSENRASALAHGDRSTVARETTPRSDRTRAMYPIAPTVIDGDLLAYPPRTGATMTVVYLHGVHGRAKNGCPWLRNGASELGWLVCPEANVTLADGSSSWGGSMDAQLAVVARAKAAAKAQGASDETVLVGFSQGAYLALDLVRAKKMRAKALVLLGADVAPTAAELRAAGVSRIVLGAGSNDGSFATLTRSAQRLEHEGFEVRLVDLGPVGHTYAGEDPSVLSDAIAWAGRA